MEIFLSFSPALRKIPVIVKIPFVKRHRSLCDKVIYLETCNLYSKFRENWESQEIKDHLEDKELPGSRENTYQSWMK